MRMVQDTTNETQEKTDELAKANGETTDLASHDESVADLIQFNVGDDFALHDLERVTVPTGGAETWQNVPMPGGEEDTDSIKGIVVAVQPNRAYYADDYGTDTDGPDCQSPDGEHGFGDPGGVCAQCPYSQWGSAERGNGQACTMRKDLLVLIPDTNLPFRISLPPTSLTNWKKYGLSLARDGKRHYAVVTEFRLRRTENKAGISYSQAEMAKTRDLEDDELTDAEAMATAMKQLLEANTAMPDAAAEVSDDSDNTGPDWDMSGSDAKDIAAANAEDDTAANTEDNAAANTEDDELDDPFEEDE